MTSTSAGTLVMADAPVPTGARSVTGGTSLGGSPSFNLGALTLTGTKNDAYMIQNAGGANITLTSQTGGKTMTVAFTSVVFSSGLTGTFPASGTTPTIYFGLTVQVQTTANSVPGTYTGSLPLKVKDTTGNKTSSPAVNFTITIKVDPTGITLANPVDLSFGTFFPGSASGTVQMTPAGARSATGGVTLGAFNAGSAGSFLVSGALSAMYTITLSPSATLTSGSNTMAVNSINSSPSANGTLSSAGTQTLTIGATLTVGANQAQGHYSGSISVTVAYD